MERNAGGCPGLVAWHVNELRKAVRSMAARHGEAAGAEYLQFLLGELVNDEPAGNESAA